MKYASETLDRRTFARLLMAGTAAVALTRLSHPGEVGAQEAAAAAMSNYRTTTDLRLRTGPGTRRRIILVMPRGSTVTNLGAVKNGFAKVSYKGTEGWASLDYLTATDGSQDPVLLGTAVTTSAVNLRSGPSTSNQVLRVLAAGTSVQTSDTVKNGFRYVVHNGLGRLGLRRLPEGRRRQPARRHARHDRRAQPARRPEHEREGPHRHAGRLEGEADR